MIVREALQNALSKANAGHSVEVENLRAQLAEAQSRFERAKSQAQLTKAGFVYVISNLGSFGENVYKVGMTRRLEPMERVKELSDASVPFPFDVHMMISCEDAPKLESALHRDLHKSRLNKINLRREFFRADLNYIRRLVEKNFGSVEYVATPEALEYRESVLTAESGSFEDYTPDLEVADEAEAA
jgi:Meiotically up-regulated gene 113